MSGLAATETGAEDSGGVMMRRTVAVVDMVAYSSIAKLLEENISAASVAELNRQIQGFMNRALAQVEDQQGYCRLALTGDGIILLFERAEDAHCFASHVHRFAREHNDERSLSTAERWFRVGIATGDVSSSACSGEMPQYAGITIANAVRLESAAEPGEILVDRDTYDGLAAETKKLYGPEETVHGKREERFRARRCCVTPKTEAVEPEGRASARISRRTLLAGTATLAAGAGVAGWMEWPHLVRWIHPMPDKRFVALLAWPRATGGTAPLVSGALAMIHTRLSRAESYVRGLLVVAADDLDEDEETSARVERQDSPADVAQAWNANLILAANVVERTGATAGATLLLRVLDAAAMKPIRSDQLTFSPDDPGDLYRRAADASARLLDLPLKEVEFSDDAELARVSPELRRQFEEARALGNEPNGTGADRAIRMFGDILERHPQFALAYAELGNLLVAKFKRTHDAAALPLARKNLMDALRRNPDSERAQLGEAKLELAEGNPDRALAGLNRILKQDPLSSDALLLKAKAFQEMNKTAEEAEIYRRLTQVRPNYWQAYNDLGLCLFAEAKYAEAAKCYEMAAQIAPRVALPLTNLGVLYLAMGRNAEAKETLKRSLELAPSETAYSNLGDVAFQEKNYRAARDFYLEALKLTPRDSLIQADVGDCYEMLGDKAKVTESYTRAADLRAAALKINPDDGLGWMTLAFYQAKIGQTAQAEADIALAEEHGATSVEAQFTKARALMLMGRTDEAKALVLACLDKGLAPANVDLAVELGPVRSGPEYVAKVGKAGQGMSPGV